MRRSLARVFAAAVVCACLLAALPSVGAVQTRSQGRTRSLTMRPAPNATSTPAPPTAPAHKNGTRNSTVTPLRPAVECFSVDVCHSRCSLAYNRTKPLVVKPVIPEEFDSDRSHLSCCESGCSRRTPSSLTACEDQCARSPWIPDGALPTSEFDSTQEARGLEGRFPVYPTFLELSRRLSPHATDSVQSEEDELGARPVPTRRQRIMRFASNTTAPAANASAPASVLSARPNGTRPSNSTRPAPRPVEYLINLVPEAPRAANKSSPNAAQTEEDELAAAMRGLMPERAHIPADILQYMEGQARLAASIAKTQKTVYVTKAEKLRNLGEYHKQLCILGCRLRCKDPKPGSVPVPAAPRHSNGTSTATNATAAKPASPAPASVAPAPSNTTATKSSSVRQLLRLAQRVAAREEEEARASAESEASEADSEEGDGGQPESEADLSAFDEAPAPRQLSWDNPS